MNKPNTSVLQCPECKKALVNIGSKVERIHPIARFVKDYYMWIVFSWVIFILIIGFVAMGGGGGVGIGLWDDFNFDGSLRGELLSSQGFPALSCHRLSLLRFS